MRYAVNAGLQANGWPCGLFAFDPSKLDLSAATRFYPYIAGIPEQELLKAQLTLQIYTILKDSDMTQVEIAKILGVQQPQVSLLMRNRAGNFSVGRLMEFLTALRQDVEITVRPTRKEHGALSVISA